MDLKLLLLSWNLLSYKGILKLINVMKMDCRMKTSIVEIYFTINSTPQKLNTIIMENYSNLRTPGTPSLVLQNFLFRFPFLCLFCFFPPQIYDPFATELPPDNELLLIYSGYRFRSSPDLLVLRLRESRPRGSSFQSLPISPLDVFPCAPKGTHPVRGVIAEHLGLGKRSAVVPREKKQNQG